MGKSQAEPPPCDERLIQLGNTMDGERVREGRGYFRNADSSRFGDIRSRSSHCATRGVGGWVGSS